MRPTDFIYNLNQRNLEYLRKTISAFLNRNSLIFSYQLNLETHSAMKTSYQKNTILQMDPANYLEAFTLSIDLCTFSSVFRQVFGMGCY